jgi:hypothetical protein
MTDPRDDDAMQRRATTQPDGASIAASSSESGGLYDDDGATVAMPDGVPRSDEEDEAPPGEAPDIPDRES